MSASNITEQFHWVHREFNRTYNIFYHNQTQRLVVRPVETFLTFYTLDKVFLFVCVTLGFPGNILSAIIWLRVHFTGKNSSAVYLAALAVNDLAYLLCRFGWYMIPCVDGWLCDCERFISESTTIMEPLLVLGYSVERLIAISCPLQVRLPVYSTVHDRYNT